MIVVSRAKDYFNRSMDVVDVLGNLSRTWAYKMKKVSYFSLQAGYEIIGT
jgi:hypothetical protein